MSCPTCKKPTVTKYRPFCSKRCADVDLGRWFDGTYTIADNSAEGQSEAAAELEKPISKLH